MDGTFVLKSSRVLGRRKDGVTRIQRREKPSPRGMGTYIYVCSDFSLASNGNFRSLPSHTIMAHLEAEVIEFSPVANGNSSPILSWRAWRLRKVKFGSLEGDDIA